MGLKLLTLSGFDFSDEACASAVMTDVSPGGSGDLTWTSKFKAGPVAIPPRYAPVLVLSNSGAPVWGGRIEEWSIQGWGNCDGSVSYRALGWADQLTERAISEFSKFGPRPTQRTGETDPSYPIITLTAEGAIRWAIRLCQNVSYFQESGPEHLLLEETRNYVGSKPQDVINDMSAYFANLSTSYMYHVRPSGMLTATLRWKPRDLAVKYWVRAEDVKIDIRNTVTELFNEAIVPYGNGNDQVASAISGTTLPGAGTQSIIKSRVINLSGQVQGKSQAFGVASGLVQQSADERTGWSYVINIPQAAKIYQYGLSDPIEKITVQSGVMVRIVGMSGGAFGKDYAAPTEHYITEARYTAKDDSLSLSCGTTPVQRSAAIIKGVAESQGTLGPVIQLWDSIGKSIKSSDAVEIFGPSSEDVQSVSVNQAAGIIPGIPTMDNRQKEQRPETLPPLPPPLSYQINNPSEVGIKGRQVIPPLRLLRWFIVADKPAVTGLTVRISLRSTGETILLASLSASQTEKVEQIFIPQKDLAKAWDMFIYEVTVADAALEWVVVGLWTARYFPKQVGKPVNKAPLK